MRLILITSLFLAYAISLTSASILLPDGIEVETVAFNHYAFEVEGITANITILKLNPCSDNIPDLSGILPLVTYAGCDYTHFFTPLINANPIAIIFTTGGIRQAGWFTSSQTEIDSLEYPIYEMSGYHASKVQNDSSITLGVTHNNYREFFDSPGLIILNVIIALLGLASLILTLYKLILFCKYRPFTWKSLPHINLSLLLCFFILVTAWMVDPLYVRRYFTFLESEMFMTIATPLLMVTCCIIALFWLQVVNKVMATTALKGKHYYLCVGISTGISVLTVILGILKSVRKIEIFGVQLVIFIFFIGISVIYIVAGAKLLVSLKRSKGIRASKEANYRRVATGFLLCSLSSIGYIGAGLATLLASFSIRPAYTSVVSTLLVNFFAILLGLFQVIFTRTPTDETSTSRDSKSREMKRRQSMIKTESGPSRNL